jgi:hypothetical protein
LDILIAPKEEANAWQLIKDHSLGSQANGRWSLRWRRHVSGYHWPVVHLNTSIMLVPFPAMGVTSNQIRCLFPDHRHVKIDPVLLKSSWQCAGASKVFPHCALHRDVDAYLSLSMAMPHEPHIDHLYKLPHKYN